MAFPLPKRMPMTNRFYADTIEPRARLTDCSWIGEPPQPTRFSVFSVEFEPHTAHPSGTIFANIGKRLVKSPKIYFRDTGLLHYFLGIRSAQISETHPARGMSWEAFIIDQMISASSAVG
jgi:hypothetical protein